MLVRGGLTAILGVKNRGVADSLAKRCVDSRRVGSVGDRLPLESIADFRTMHCVALHRVASVSKGPT